MFKFFIKVLENFLKGADKQFKNCRNVKSWCLEDVSDFIKSIPGCSHLAKLFKYEVIFFRNSVL